MPIYEYLCRQCDHVFSVLTFSRAGEQPVCPSCGSTDVVKKMSVFGCSLHSGHSGPSGYPSSGLSGG